MATAPSASSAATHHLLQHLVRPPPQPSLLFSLRPAYTVAAATNAAKAVLSNHCKSLQLQRTTRRPPTLFSSFRFSHSLSESSLGHFKATLASSLAVEHEAEEDQVPSEPETEEAEEQELAIEEESDDIGSDTETFGLELEDSAVEVKAPANVKRNSSEVPNLTVKEKKELASYAHSLGKKLKSQLVGKSGVTDNVATSFIETLEANELLKIKIHRTCPGELEDVVQQLEEATGSVVVNQIGRTVIIYRPSLAKLKAEEKKRQTRRVFVRKDPKLGSITPRRTDAPRRLSGQGRRGSSRG